MIRKIEIAEIQNRMPLSVSKNDQNSQIASNKPNPNFKSAGSFLVTAMQACEKHPMLNVSVIDLTTAIGPRSIIETVSGPKVEDKNGRKRRQLNWLAGGEAIRREGSGLIINCLIPGFIVQGVSKIIQKPILGKNFRGSDLSNVWADSQSLDKISKYYINAEGNDEKRIFNTFKNMLSDLTGADGNVARNGNTDFTTRIKNIDKYAQDMTDCVLKNYDKDKHLKRDIKKIYEKLVGETHIAEHIKFNGDEKYLNSNLESLTDDAVRVVRELHKNNIKDASAIEKYITKAQKLVKAKSLGGMAIVIPLAISAQPINRWITRKTAGGMRGAPIYDEFKDKNNREEGNGVKLTPKEKAALLRQKIISISSMVGVALLSMTRLPNMAMLEFRGRFPSMDMARIVSTSTFASRMGTSEDKHELKLSTVRDITTFASMYFLGDYVAKAIATIIEKLHPDISLLHRFKEVPKDANIFKKFHNWAKNTSIKSSDELATQKLKNLRSGCHAGNLAFSLLVLGVIMPIITVAKARKGRNEDIKNSQNTNTNININNETQLTGMAA